MIRHILIIGLILISACSSKYQHDLFFNASEPLRVAVLPFVQVNKNGQVIDGKSELLLDNVSLVSSKSTLPPSSYVRNLVQDELTKSGLDLVSPSLVDANLSHNGFDDLSRNPPFQLEKILLASPDELCSKLFSCDAVLFGKITNWDRDYYAIQSVNTVGIELKLISAKDKKVLFSSVAKDSDSRGITKGPTGFSNILIEPIKGLDNQIILDLARKVVGKMLSPLHMENRPEFLQSAPPAIFASAHDAESGSLSKDSALTVVALGSSKNLASFSIGNIIENIPMIEKESGHYIGKYIPLKSDSFSNQAVYVALTDQFGRTTRQKLGTNSLSLVN
jgi:Putative bacterial lipoprotein (DUF799)